MTLSDKTLSFSEEQARIQVNWDALAMQPPGAGSVGRVTTVKKAVLREICWLERVYVGNHICPHL